MEVSIIQYDPDPVEHAMERKKRLLVDGIVSRASVIPNMIHAQLKASWMRHRLFLKDVIVRGRLAIQQNTGPVKEALQEKETIPDGENIKREARNNQDDIEAIDKKDIIPGGWNSQGEVCNVRHKPGPVKAPWRRKL